MGSIRLPRNKDGVEFAPGDWIAVGDGKAEVLGISSDRLFYRTDGPITWMESIYAKPATAPDRGEES